MAAALTPDVVIRADAETGEGPVWDHRTGELVWVDIPAGVLHRSDTASRRDMALRVGTMVGAVAPTTAAEGWAAATEDGFGIIDGRGRLELLDRVIPQAHLRMNDGACDSQGRLWAGSLTRSFDVGGGRLHCWEHGRPSWAVIEGLTLPNGIGWSGGEMYLADTKQGAVFAYAFDVADAHIGSRRTAIEIPPERGMPDGLCVDAEGCLWVAHWGGWRVCRYDPRGRLLETAEFPVAQPSSCAFGPDTTMYVTTAWEGLPDRGNQPLAGSVFAFDAGVGGGPAWSFRV